ncbi:hypothetical protein T492DRAFT_1029723 [Pavlovales sp. CCMP2436]|nr:hypothetical protein T492DRAFT_1029723 [Pavlovales sp. CCMP2436]|mmetsp:Transcript_15440/g.39168  ORF Transcript_15440/g.39168 Transcript_15440/m.39168 type:complete len:165 (+) Transcript_15440:141-635(+)
MARNAAPAPPPGCTGRHAPRQARPPACRRDGSSSDDDDYVEVRPPRAWAEHKSESLSGNYYSLQELVHDGDDGTRPFPGHDAHGSELRPIPTVGDDVAFELEVELDREPQPRFAGATVVTSRQTNGSGLVLGTGHAMGRLRIGAVVAPVRERERDVEPDPSPPV